ncbi:ribosomal oxygenase 1-like [Amphiura filiformis]|uniref:ribosomal oxygenase 1-like n=1 Tax=Amphiura filiformis TaxID=82378 RepID=UPI003B223BBF
MADQSSDVRAKKRVSAFAVFQSQKSKSNPSTSANSNSILSMSVLNKSKSKSKKEKKAEKRKANDTPSKPMQMAKKLRMSLRKRGKDDDDDGKDKKAVESDLRASGDGISVNGTNNEEKAAIYVQQEQEQPSTSEKSPNQENEASEDRAPAKNLEDLFSRTPHTDSTQEAARFFEWLIHPVKADNFFSHLFERKPLLLRRHNPSYNEGLFSSAEMDKILRKNDIQFTRNVDITSYTDGKRETHNPEGRALAPVVWDYYQNGCSIRMLNPQTYSHAVWKLNSTLQEYFSCLVGANVYLTPSGTQGFAPHYDDIEAFVIQLEGKKHWRLYKPRNDNETLPRFSSGNFSQEDIGEPILDTILEPGDLLYFPRGIIHQANALEDTHSLHITLSTCQKTTWGDFLEKLVPRALQVALEEDVEFRHALPRDYLNYMGIAFADTTHPKRLEFLQKVSQLMMKLSFYAPMDAAADKMATDYMHDALPPVISKEEESCSIFGSSTSCSKGVVSGKTQLENETEIRLLRRGVARLISDGNQCHVYHCMENARWYHGKEPQFMEVPIEAGPAIEHLIQTYPEYITISSLPLTGEFEEQQVELAQKLYETGLIVTKSPLQAISEDEEEEV